MSRVRFWIENSFLYHLSLNLWCRRKQSWTPLSTGEWVLCVGSMCLGWSPPEILPLLWGFGRSWRAVDNCSYLNLSNNDEFGSTDLERHSFPNWGEEEEFLCRKCSHVLRHFLNVIEQVQLPLGLLLEMWWAEDELLCAGFPERAELLAGLPVPQPQELLWSSLSNGGTEG